GGREGGVEGGGRAAAGRREGGRKGASEAPWPTETVGRSEYGDSKGGVGSGCYSYVTITHSNYSNAVSWGCRVFGRSSLVTLTPMSRNRWFPSANSFARSTQTSAKTFSSRTWEAMVLSRRWV